MNDSVWVKKFYKDLVMAQASNWYQFVKSEIRDEMCRNWFYRYEGG